jgi:glucose/arabinose dehydrogenase
MEAKMRFSAIAAATAASALLGVISGPILAQQRGNAQQAHSSTQSFDPGSLPDQTLGRRFTVKPEDLPAPMTGPIVAARPLSLPYQGQAVRVPEGFTATPFAIGLTHPRRLLVLPNGDVIVAEQRAGYLTLLRDADGDGKAEWIQRHAEGFNGPYGLAWREDAVLVADQDGIWKVPHRLDALRPGRGAVQRKAADIPPDQRKPSPRMVGEEMMTAKGVFGIVQGHSNRHLALDPKTGAMLVGVGSAGNIGVEPEVKASIQRFESDGSGQSTFASGLRNPTALAFHPETGELYTVVQERDGLGDLLVPDFLTRVVKGAFYGWPYAYIGQHPQPGFAQLRPDKVEASITPDLLFEAHSSAMDLVFYTGEQFPSEYRGSAFVALKGSWNRSEPTGYKIVPVPFKDGQPEGSYENFAAGFWVSGRSPAEVWGRPAALAVAKDGSLLIGDDTGGTIWRIAYSASPQQSGKPDGDTTGVAPR